MKELDKESSTPSKPSAIKPVTNPLPSYTDKVKTAEKPLGAASKVTVKTVKTLSPTDKADSHCPHEQHKEKEQSPESQALNKTATDSPPTATSAKPTPIPETLDTFLIRPQETPTPNTAKFCCLLPGNTSLMLKNLLPIQDHDDIIECITDCVKNQLTSTSINENWLDQYLSLQQAISTGMTLLTDLQAKLKEAEDQYLARTLIQEQMQQMDAAMEHICEQHTWMDCLNTKTSIEVNC